MTDSEYETHLQWVFRPWVRPSTGRILYHPELPADSICRDWALRPLRGFIRPWKPAGETPGGIWVQRHDRHPAVWCFLLAAVDEDIERYNLRFDWLYHYKRFSDEFMGEDATKDPLFLGEKHPVNLVRLDQMTVASVPAPLSLPV